MLASVRHLARPARHSLRPALCAAVHPVPTPPPQLARCPFSSSLPALTSSASPAPSLSFPISRCFSSFSIVVPSLGDSISEGTIAELTKREGDSVDADEIVARLETDKVSMDIRSSSSGLLKGIKVKQGDTVKVGDVLMEADTEGAGGGAATGGAKPEEPKPEKKEEQRAEKQEKPASQQSSPEQQQPTRTQAIDSADHNEQHRAHHPLIHFRHGRREEEAAATPAASTRRPAAAAAAAASPPKPASAASSAPSASVRSPPQLDAASYFNVSGWQDGNERWAGARKSLPARYAGRRVGEAEQELVMMGGALPYTPKALMQPSKPDKDKQQPAKRK